MKRTSFAFLAVSVMANIAFAAPVYAAQDGAQTDSQSGPVLHQCWNNAIPGEPCRTRDGTIRTAPSQGDGAGAISYVGPCDADGDSRCPTDGTVTTPPSQSNGGGISYVGTCDAGVASTCPPTEPEAENNLASDNFCPRIIQREDEVLAARGRRSGSRARSGRNNNFGGNPEGEADVQSQDSDGNCVVTSVQYPRN